MYVEIIEIADLIGKAGYSEVLWHTTAYHLRFYSSYATKGEDPLVRYKKDVIAENENSKTYQQYCYVCKLHSGSKNPRKVFKVSEGNLRCKIFPARKAILAVK